MIIDLQNNFSSMRASANAAQPVEASRAESAHDSEAPGAAVEMNDQAHLSSAASLAAQAASLPDVRMDKVAAMQSALANGYQVSSTDVAESMINQMLGRSR